MSEDIYATIERVNGKLQSRILEEGKPPYVFEPDAHGWFTTKCDVVHAVNEAYPGVTYCAMETFERLVARSLAS